MHELSIVEALFDQAEREIRRLGHEGRVLRMDLTIGRLSGVNSDSIRFAFELLKPETIFDRAELAIEEPPAACRCRACGAESEVSDITAECPRCGSHDIIIEGGREMLLQSIELED